MENGEEDLAAIQGAIDDMLAGDVGEDAFALIQQIRERLGLDNEERPDRG
jgi:hypothetical protein